MRIVYLDCFSGISGDMFMGALVDAGISPKLLEDTVTALDLGARLEISRVQRGGIAATKVNVITPKPGTHQHGRHLREIRSIIDKVAISSNAKNISIKIFEALGEAEADIHNTSIEKIHFHEVGAVDAIVDIVCAAVGAEALAAEQWICSPLNVGGGTVQCAHGVLPVPAPATLKLLRDAPVYSSGPQVELVTPTGAAIVRTLCSRFTSFPAIKIERAGYGAGTREFPDHPNLLRLTIGESITETVRTSPYAAPIKEVPERERIAVLEANLDDLSPQVLGYAMERLLTEGALDVFSIPVQMKKSRPGALLTVLAKTGDADRLAKLIFAETTTLGVRCREEYRQVLTRRWETVATTWGPVRIKIANMNGTVSNYAPEYEDCRALAEAQHVPLRTVIQDAVQQYLRSDRKA
jgi:pyridinium-3,5-bisthiocarboxylic acid mononucleotide nickel chelatase